MSGCRLAAWSRPEQQRVFYWSTIVDHIREALLKANASLRETRRAEAANLSPGLISPPAKETIQAGIHRHSWAPPQVQLSSHHLEANRIVSAAMDDPTHIAFNILRTRVQKVQRDNKWKTILVTSPTPGCGKTMVGLNLAFSLSRTPNYRTVLIDLDLKKPSVAKTLGVKARGSIGQFLEGKIEAEDCFVQVNQNLVVGLNSDRVRHSSELVQSPRMGELLNFVTTYLSPKIVMFDLPPMQTSDDVLALLPRVDAALLVVAAGATTATELDECEQQISQLEKLLGIVINKSESDTSDYYY